MEHEQSQDNNNYYKSTRYNTKKRGRKKRMGEIGIRRKTKDITDNNNENS